VLPCVELPLIVGGAVFTGGFDGRGGGGGGVVGVVGGRAGGDADEGGLGLLALTQRWTRM
jgi:hypothetical protein